MLLHIFFCQKLLTCFMSFAGSGFPASQDQPQSFMAAYHDICIQVGCLSAEHVCRTLVLWRLRKLLDVLCNQGNS